MNAMQNHLKVVNSVYSIGTYVTDGFREGRVYANQGTEKYLVETTEGKVISVLVSEVTAIRPAQRN